MGSEVRWTASARADVEGIMRHIAVVLDSPKAASDHLDEFIAAAGRISEFPELCPIGTHPALARRHLRPLFVKSCVMLYSHDANTVTVHRIFHTMQDYARLIEK